MKREIVIPMTGPDTCPCRILTSDQTQEFLHLILPLGIMEGYLRASVHHSNMVLRGLRGALTWVPITPRGM